MPPLRTTGYARSCSQAANPLSRTKRISLLSSSSSSALATAAHRHHSSESKDASRQTTGGADASVHDTTSMSSRRSSTPATPKPSRLLNLPSRHKTLEEACVAAWRANAAALWRKMREKRIRETVEMVERVEQALRERAEEARKAETPKTPEASMREIDYGDDEIHWDDPLAPAPGESEVDFQEPAELLDEIDFDDLLSPSPGEAELGCPDSRHVPVDINHVVPDSNGLTNSSLPQFDGTTAGARPSGANDDLDDLDFGPSPATTTIATTSQFVDQQFLYIQSRANVAHTLKKWEITLSYFTNILRAALYPNWNPNRSILQPVRSHPNGRSTRSGRRIAPSQKARDTPARHSSATHPSTSEEVVEISDEEWPASFARAIRDSMPLVTQAHEMGAAIDEFRKEVYTAAEIIGLETTDFGTRLVDPLDWMPADEAALAALADLKVYVATIFELGKIQNSAENVVWLWKENVPSMLYKAQEFLDVADQALWEVRDALEGELDEDDEEEEEWNGLEGEEEGGEYGEYDEGEGGDDERSLSME